MKNLNTKALCKQIKASRNQMIWSRYDGIHLITNRHWAIKLQVLSPDVLVTLISIFEGKQPDEGQALTNFMGPAIEREAIRYDIEVKNAIPYKRTKYTRDFRDNARMRVFLADEKIVYVNDNYLLVCNEHLKAEGVGGITPVHFPEINYMVLPIRVEPDHDLISIMEADAKC